jgi:hypothetical protein
LGDYRWLTKIKIKLRSEMIILKSDWIMLGTRRTCAARMHTMVGGAGGKTDGYLQEQEMCPGNLLVWWAMGKMWP